MIHNLDLIQLLFHNYRSLPNMNIEEKGNLLICNVYKIYLCNDVLIHLASPNMIIDY